MRRFGATLIGLLMLGVIAQPVRAQLLGKPPVVEFTPTLDAYPQNFAIAQDAASVVYIGNSEGVLSFDGERWSLIRLPNNDLARSLAADGNRIYVGGYDCFGYLQRDDTGTPRFHDLTHLFAAQLKGRSFADIWQIAVTPQGVFFQAVQDLFQYVPATGATRMWHYADRFGAMTRQSNGLLVQFRGLGLRQLKNGNWEPVAGGDAFKDQIYQFLHLEDDGLIGIARDGNWRALQNGLARDYAMPAGFPSSNAFSAGLTLADGSLALGSPDGALYVVQPGHPGFRSFRLASSRISGIVAARDGGLLAVTDTGFVRIAWPTRWSVLGEEQGLRGNLYRTARWGDRWFVLTGAGVYEETPTTDGTEQRFERRDWVQHEAWDLLGLDPNQALLAASYRLLLLRGSDVEPLSSPTFYPRILLRSRFDPDVVYAGTEMGFGVVRLEHGHWKLVLEQDDMQNPTINSLVETAPGELWMGSERGGIWRVRLSADDARMLDRQHMDSKAGIVYGTSRQATVASLDSGLMASTAAGLFRYQDGRFVRTDMDGLDRLRGDDEVLQLEKAPAGGLWAYGERRLYRRPKGGSWRREDLPDARNGALQSMTFETDGAMVLTTSNGVLRYSGTRQSAAAKPVAPQVALTGVEFVNLADGSRRGLDLRGGEQFKFAQGDFGVAFHFAEPDYRRAGAVRYAARLVPYEPTFSAWAPGNSYTYSRLVPGVYRFELRGRDSTGRITQIVPFRFVILRSWYARGWAWLTWVVLSLLALAALTHLLVRLRTRRLALETARLEDMVRQRTRALESANRLLDSIAHLDGLTEIPNRRRLDEYLSQTWRQCAQHARTLAVLLIDVDHFKIYNDRHGHPAGDDLLKRLAATLSGCLRRGDDLVARYGGEEFLAVLPGADAATAHAIAETMRRVVEDNLGATISVGVAACRPTENEREIALVDAADAALYRAKMAGRNRVETASEESPGESRSTTA